MTRAPRAAKAESAPKQVTLLDLKRCTAIGIKMARLKVPWQVRAHTQGGAPATLDVALFRRGSCQRSVRHDLRAASCAALTKEISGNEQPVPPLPCWQSAADAILCLDPAAFETAEDIATVMQCLPSEDERGMLQVGGGLDWGPSMLWSGGRPARRAADTLNACWLEHCTLTTGP